MKPGRSRRVRGARSGPEGQGQVMSTARVVGLLSAAAITFSGAGIAASGVHANAAATQYCPYKVVASSGLNIRSGPGTKYRVIKTVPNGTTGLGSNPSTSGWRTFSGGWASASYLQRQPGLCAV